MMKNELKNQGFIPIHDHNGANPLPKAAFNQQRYIHHTVFVSFYPVFEYLPKYGPPNSRMYYGIQLFPVGFVCEDDATQFLAV